MRLSSRYLSYLLQQSNEVMMSDGRVSNRHLDIKFGSQFLVLFEPARPALDVPNSLIGEIDQTDVGDCWPLLGAIEIGKC